MAQARFAARRWTQKQGERSDSFRPLGRNDFTTAGTPIGRMTRVSADRSPRRTTVGPQPTDRSSLGTASGSQEPPEVVEQRKRNSRRPADGVPPVGAIRRIRVIRVIAIQAPPLYFAMEPGRPGAGVPRVSRKKEARPGARAAHCRRGHLRKSASARASGPQRHLRRPLCTAQIFASEGTDQRPKLPRRALDLDFRRSVALQE
jgi:hypothetical protein